MASILFANTFLTTRGSLGFSFKNCPASRAYWIITHFSIQFLIFSNGKSHIVVPIYPRKNDLNFFICGTLKQPKITDIKIGFSLLPDDNGMDYLSDIDALEDSLTCDGTHKADKYYHFGYMTEESNFMGAIFMDKIDACISEEYKLYPGPTILFYGKKGIEKKVYYSHPIYKLMDMHIRESLSLYEKIAW
uniref:Peptidase S1 domain-containing protein n=1 Tax=Parastrongyloides trichosuri TaxID=131310 RepID=A0A0N4Z7E4_PARTI